MRVGVASVFTPGIAGGAEIHARGLADALAEAGHQVHALTMPFRFKPAPVTEAMARWQAMDFSRYGGGAIDTVICLQFPTWLLSHPDKRAWILHQHRAAYELYGTEHGLADDADGRALRDAIAEADAASLAGIPLHANSARVAERLFESTGLRAAPLYHPPRGPEQFYCGESLPYVFFPSRLEALKRQDLLIAAMALVPAGIGAIIAGEGGARGALEALIGQHGLGERVRLVGRVSRAEMLALYANARAVFFGPLDEDYGYVTLEAMLAGKPVVTCTDSGGPLEFVADGETGFVVAPEPEDVAGAVARLADDPARAIAMGAAGREAYAARDIGWAQVVDTLLAPAVRP